MKIVLLGAPGAGKGTLASQMCQAYGLEHISTGDMLRSHMREGTELGVKARSFVDAGALVPDALIIAMVQKKLEEGGRGCLFDGFPRTAPQAEALSEIAAIDAVIYIDVPVDVLVKRISGRRVCPKCGAVTHTSWYEGTDCEKCGEPLVIRDDDKPETVLNRIEVYNRNTEPLIGYYRDKGLLATVDGSGTPEEVFAAVKALMEKRS